jgi:hypothetical protein
LTRTNIPRCLKFRRHNCPCEGIDEDTH